MARRHHYRRQDKDPPELNVTTFLNLMVVLVPFLLITAVFSRITIQELNLPQSAASAAQSDVKPVEVIVRADKLEVDDGRNVITTIPKINEQYDFKGLSQRLHEIKEKYPDQEDAFVLMEPDLEYEHLIETMDAVRSVNIRKDEQSEDVNTVVLFPNISVGDAYEVSGQK